MKRLNQDPASASKLSEEMGLKTGTVSNYLYRLKRMDPAMVTCLTPHEPHHRLYGLTEVGDDMLEYL